jgi:hypothetical protein
MDMMRPMVVVPSTVKDYVAEMQMMAGDEPDQSGMMGMHDGHPMAPARGASAAKATKAAKVARRRRPSGKKGG